MISSISSSVMFIISDWNRKGTSGGGGGRGRGESCGRAFISDPGIKRSMSLGDWPDRLGRPVSGMKLASSNRLSRLLVTESGSNLGLTACRK